MGLEQIKGVIFAKNRVMCLKLTSRSRLSQDFMFLVNGWALARGYENDNQLEVVGVFCMLHSPRGGASPALAYCGCRQIMSNLHINHLGSQISAMIECYFICTSI